MCVVIVESVQIWDSHSNFHIIRFAFPICSNLDSHKLTLRFSGLIQTQTRYPLSVKLSNFYCNVIVSSSIASYVSPVLWIGRCFVEMIFVIFLFESIVECEVCWLFMQILFSCCKDNFIPSDTNMSVSSITNFVSYFS